MSLGKRQFERFDIFLIVEFRPRNKKFKYSQGVTENISHEGFSFASQSHYFKPEEILEFRLKHPHSGLSLTVLGEIVWKREGWYKCITEVKFKDINEVNKNKIAELLSIAEIKHAKSYNYEKEDEPAEMCNEGKESATEPGAGQEEELQRETLKEDNSTDLEETVESTIFPPKDSSFTTSTSSGYIDEAINQMSSVNRIETTKADNAQVRDKNLIRVQDKRQQVDRETVTSEKTLTGAKTQRKKSWLYIPLAVVFATVSIIALSGKFENIKQGLINLTSTENLIPTQNTDNRQLVTSVDNISPDSMAKQEFVGQMQVHEPIDIKNILPDKEKTNGSEQTLMTSATDQDTDNKQPLVAVDNTLSKNITERELPDSGRQKMTGDKTGEFPGGEQITNIKQPEYQETDGKHQAYVDEDSQAEIIISNELPGPQPPQAIKEKKNSLTVQEEKPDSISIDTEKTDFSKSSIKLPLLFDEELTKRIMRIQKSIESDQQLSLHEQESIPVENEKAADIKQPLPEVKAEKEISDKNIQVEVVPEGIADEQTETVLIEEKKKIVRETAEVKVAEDSEADEESTASDEESAASSEELVEREELVKRDIPKTLESEESVMDIPEIKEESVESLAIPAEETPEKPKSRSGINLALVIQKGGRQTAAHDEKEEIKTKTVVQNTKIKTAAADELKEIKKETVTETMESRKVEPAEPGKKKKESITFLEEGFDNNNNEWDIFNSSAASAQIKGGKYNIENKRKEGAHFVFHPHDFPHDSDFTLEISMKAGRLSDNAYGFVFGARDVYNNSVFLISRKRYDLIKNSNGAPQSITGGKIGNSIVKRNAFNTLKIEKIGGIIRFYINDYFIREVMNISFEGNKIGFIIEGELKISVDRIRSRITSY